MVALHVVGVDFQHGLRVGAGRGAGTEVGVRLLRSRLLRARSHIHLAGKCPLALAVEHALEQHVARTLRGEVFDQDVVVHPLRPVGHDGSEELRLCSFAAQPDVHAVACGAARERHAVVAQAAVCLEFGIERGEARVLGVALLHAVQLHFSPFCGKDLHHLGGEVAVGLFGVVTQQYRAVCALLGHDQHAAHAHTRRGGCRHVYHLYRGLQFCPFGQVNQHAVLRQQGVQQRHAVVSRRKVAVRTGCLVIVAAQQVGV